MSSSTRSAELIAKGTPINICVIGICCATYVYQFIVDPSLFNYTINAQKVLLLNEWYRLVTHVFFHHGLLHLVMNLSGTYVIGSYLEKRYGSLGYMFTVLWSIVLTGVLYVFVAFGLCFVFHYDSLMYTHGIGFSGVIFHLMVLEADILASDMTLERTRSVFGFFHVPLVLYPWACLVAFSLLVPQVSFMGHLSGILVGSLQTYGILDMLLPSFSFLREMEDWTFFNTITGSRNFVPTPTDSALMSTNLIRVHAENDRYALIQSISKSCKTAFKFARDIIETLKVCIFGYGPIFGMFDSSRETQEESDRW